MYLVIVVDDTGDIELRCYRDYNKAKAYFDSVKEIYEMVYFTKEIE